MSTWNITPPALTDAERAQAARAGGLSGEHVDTGLLLGKPTPGRVFKPFPALAALQQLSHVYAGPVEPCGVPGNTGRRLTEAKIAHRRARNRAARKSRRTNRAAHR